MSGVDKHNEQWPLDDHFATIVEISVLSEAEVAEYCRKKGLYTEQQVQWKQEFYRHRHRVIKPP